MDELMTLYKQIISSISFKNLLSDPTQRPDGEVRFGGALRQRAARLRRPLRRLRRRRRLARQVKHFDYS